MRALEVTAWRTTTTLMIAECPVLWDRGTLQISNVSSNEAQEILRVLAAYRELKLHGANASGQVTLDAVLTKQPPSVAPAVDTEEADALREAGDFPPVRPLETFPFNGLVCSECGEPQRRTPSGHVCCNGHGGVGGMTPEEYERKQPPEPVIDLTKAVVDSLKADAPKPEQKSEPEDEAVVYVDEQVRSASSLREVLCFWIDRGVMTKHELIVLAEKHSGEVPVLKRTRDLRARVSTLLQSINMPGLS